MAIQQMDTTTSTEIVRSLSEKTKACYVFRETAEEICERLHKHLEDGEYADIILRLRILFASLPDQGQLRSTNGR